jgi:transposase-like protein
MSDTSSGRPRRKFTDEFKADAVRLVEESDGQIAKVARELGIYDSWLMLSLAEIDSIAFHCDGYSAW